MTEINKRTYAIDDAIDRGEFDYMLAMTPARVDGFVEIAQTNGLSDVRTFVAHVQNTRGRGGQGLIPPGGGDHTPGDGGSTPRPPNDDIFHGPTPGPGQNGRPGGAPSGAPGWATTASARICAASPSSIAAAWLIAAKITTDPLWSSWLKFGAAVWQTVATICSMRNQQAMTPYAAAALLHSRAFGALIADLNDESVVDKAELSVTLVGESTSAYAKLMNELAPMTASNDESRLDVIANRDLAQLAGGATLWRQRQGRDPTPNFGGSTQQQPRPGPGASGPVAPAGLPPGWDPIGWPQGDDEPGFDGPDDPELPTSHPGDVPTGSGGRGLPPGDLTPGGGPVGWPSDPWEEPGLPETPIPQQPPSVPQNIPDIDNISEAVDDAKAAVDSVVSAIDDYT